MATILVTGGTRGIGLATVREYLGRGASVIATCRDERGAAALEAERGRGDLSIERLDVASSASIAALAGRLRTRPIDVLLNNAGIFHRSEGLADFVREHWLESFSINAIAPVELTMALLPALRLGEARKVVSLSSALGSIAGTTGGSAPYRASKAALNMAMRTLAMDLAGEGFRIAVISPGLVDTDLARDVPRAKISPAESARGIVTMIEAMTPEQNGAFLRYDGGTVQW